METEKYMKTPLLKEEKHKHGDIDYLLHASYTWETENNLSSLNSSIVKNYISSNSKTLKKTREWDIHMQQRYDVNKDWDKHMHQRLDINNQWEKHMHQRFDINDTGRIISADDIRQEDFVQWMQIMEAHTGDKHFTCNICNKKFKKRSHLKTHHRIHTGDKPFACNICNKRFIQNSTLRNHQLTHSGDKPFTCNVCGKKCITNSQLKTHHLSHTGEKPFTCDICEK